MNALADLHLLRPDWLWALLLLPALLWAWQHRQRRAQRWRSAVDAHLLPHLLAAAPGRRTRLAAAVAAAAYALCVLALAGPSWRQGREPVWTGGTPLVLAVDLSSEMLAADVPPTRLAQARAKLDRLLQVRAGAPVALVAYADDAYTVAPLTDDAANVALFVNALAPDVMPADGQRADRAIGWSAELLRRAGHAQGRIVLLTGGADAAAQEAAASARREGYRVSVLGLGSAAGALVRSRDGAVRQARLDTAGLRTLARAGGGEFTALSVDDGDLHALGLLDAGGAAVAGGDGPGRVWLDEGYWLLPPLMALALLGFRRRAGAGVLVLCLCLPGAPLRAADWWQRPDQRAHELMQRGHEAYREGRFAEAATLYRGADSADAHYNRGNALAKAGQYPQALQAYDEALKRQPGMPDALANRRAVEAAMKRKPPPGAKRNERPGSQGQKQDDSGQGRSAGGAGKSPPPPGRPAASPPDATAPPQAADAAAQQAQQKADAAQRERMQRALAKAKPGDDSGGSAAAPPAQSQAERERRLANEAWLRRVPDDPGGLLRAKLRLEHERRQREGQGP